MVFEKSTSARTAAILANVSGTHLCLIEVGGSFGRELSANGEAAMVNFAADWLAELYGNDVKKAIKRSQATRWNHEPRTLGAFSAAAPGGQGARRILMEPLQNTVWFAGEAAHETLWGTRWRRVGVRRARGRRGLAPAWRRQGGALSRNNRNACPPTATRAASHRAINDNPRLYAAGHRGGSEQQSPPRLAGRPSYARSTPPVRLPTSPTILAARASISSSVIVRSRG